MSKKTVLNLHKVCVRYGDVKALDEVSITLNEGEIVALMGPNGAGKSTVLKTVFGLTSIHEGDVLWYGQKIIPVAHQTVHRGVAYVPQGRRVFTHLTVEENLEAGGAIIKDKKARKSAINEVMRMFPVLQQKRKAPSGTLSGGQQQMLALARGLMINPKLLLLDEPSLGLAPKVVKEIFAKIKEINSTHNTAVIIVEHNITSLLEFAHRGYIFDKGKVVATDTAKNLCKNDTLEKVFLGTFNAQK